MQKSILPFHYLPGRRQDLLLLCDHASCAIPEQYAGLGLSEADRSRHIAWDPGAEGVTRELAMRLDCPAFLGGVSRLLADLNRAPDAPELILEESDGSLVPGNLGLSDLDRERRIAECTAPTIAPLSAICIHGYVKAGGLLCYPSTVSILNYMAALAPGL